MGTNVASVDPFVAASRADRLRVLLVAPPMLAVPPPTYAGTERVVATIGEELHRRGHQVALVGAGDSEVPYELIPTVERSLWSTGYDGDVASYMQHTVEIAWREAHRFDIVHAHLENHGFVFAEHCETPVLSTLHGRLDAPGMPELLEAHGRVPLVAISESQRRWFPDQNWAATIHHGLHLEPMPFSTEPGDYLAFVGRVTPEKGIREAIELARLTGLRLRVAAKVHSQSEREHFAEVVEPAIEQDELDWLGEVGARERDPLYAGALATVMLGGWPEPFGLVAIESMATGTPVIARRAGAFTETIEHGVTGFLVDDVGEAAMAVEKARDLDRRQIRERTLERFSPGRMVDEYEAAYRRILATRPGTR
ncbi:MAG TPA: glycosyltransferase family 4 protein [Candidatus Limnocylindrales bacterium]|nr:glycosyltransferase family 4 protein [Candidatus Limnocylindrales bacterium]